MRQLPGKFPYRMAPEEEFYDTQGQEWTILGMNGLSV